MQTTEVESEKSTETITMDKVDSATEEPIATIDIPQPESVEITEDQIATTLPEIEPTNTSEPQQKSKTPLWLKKILVGLRQKIEALAKLLPSAV